MLYRLFLSLFLFVPPLDDLSLSGTVFTPETEVISNATVIIENSGEGRRWELQTAEDGAFRIDRLSLGAYQVRVRKEGFFEATVEIRLEASKTIEFTLARVEQLSEQIEVIARPETINAESLSTSQTVNDEVIQSLPYTGKRNFLNALALMPGVMTDSTGGLHMHGSGSSQIRYQLDGMNLTDARTGAIATRIPIDSIESVDVDLAGYSAEYGKGSGGVVRVNSNFIQDRFRWSVTDFIPGVNWKRKTIGEFSPRLSVSGPIIANRLWFMYSGSSRYVGTFNEDLPEDGNKQTQSIVDQLLKLQWNVGESNVLTFNLLHNSEYYGNVGLSVTRPMETTTNFQRRGFSAAVSNRAVVGGGAVLETMVQMVRRRESDLPRGTGSMEIHPEGWSGNFYIEQHGWNQRLHFAQDVAWEARGAIAHRFKTGIEVDEVRYDLSLDRRDFDVYNADGAVESTVRFLGSSSAETRNVEYGAFFQDRLTLSPDLQVEMGVRADRESLIGRTNIAPRTAFSYLPFGSETSKISGGIGMFFDNVPLDHFQSPQLERRTTSTVSIHPFLKNPYGIHWNLSWENEWAPRWVTRLNFVEKHGRDQIRVAAPDGGEHLEVNNSGKTRYRALEISLDRPVRTNLRFLASYVFSKTLGRPSLSIDFPDPSLESVFDAPVAWDAPHRFLSWAYFPFFANTNASFSTEARSGFPYTAINTRSETVGGFNAHRLPAYFVVNFSIEREAPAFFGRRIAVRVGIMNLLNRFNPRFVDLNVNSPTFMQFSDSSGRSFVARLRLLK